LGTQIKVRTTDVISQALRMNLSFYESFVLLRIAADSISFPAGQALSPSRRRYSTFQGSMRHTVHMSSSATAPPVPEGPAPKSWLGVSRWGGSLSPCSFLRPSSGL